MNPPSEIVRQLLIDLGVVEESDAWTTYASFLPDRPDEAVCVYDTAGKLDGRMMQNGEVIEHQGIQIRVRGRVYIDTWNKMDEIVKALDGVRKNVVAIDSEAIYIVHNVSRSGAVVPLGIDETENHRHYHFTANMTLTLSKEP